MIWRPDSEIWFADQQTASDYVDQAGVRVILAVAHDLDICPNAYHVPFFRFPIQDNTQLDSNIMAMPVCIAETLLASSIKPLLFMCRAGLSRSASFTALIIARSRHISWNDACCRVRTARPEVFPHPSFTEQFRKLA